MAAVASDPISRRQALLAAILGIAMLVTVGGALALQHLGGYIPCKLCLEQRTPYYVGVPLMALAWLTAWRGRRRAVTRLLFAAAAALMAYGLYLAIYHAGVEWAWWPGPTNCSAVPTIETGGKGVLDTINTVVPPSCDKAALRILGLSLAGWNAIVSSVLAAVALRAAAIRG